MNCLKRREPDGAERMPCNEWKAALFLPVLCIIEEMYRMKTAYFSVDHHVR